MSRPSLMTPVLALLCAVCLTPLLIPATAHGATLTIYGKGGVTVIPPKICPESSAAACATLNFGTDPTHGVVTDLSSNAQYNYVLGTPPPQGLGSIQGQDLDVESISPIQ